MDPDESKLESPTGIAIDPSGHGLYVSDGKYIKYVSTYEAEFTITMAFGDKRASVLGQVFLPPGISMNPKNGAFFGMPVVTWEPTVYTIKAQNSKGESFINGVVRFEVVNCPETADTIVINKTISLKELPYRWNDIVLDSAGTATVKHQNITGCDSVTLLNLSVGPEFNYNSEPYILGFGQPIKPIVPTTRGSIIENFSVAPPLPAGLSLNAQTGVITGAPTVYVPGNPVPAIGPRTPPAYLAPGRL